MSENTNEELPNPIFCSTCPECGAYPLEKDTYEKDDPKDVESLIVHTLECHLG